MEASRRWVLADRPVGRSVRLEDFELRDAPLPEVGPGQLRVALKYLTVAPALKLQMENAAPYAAPLAIGDVLATSGVAEVLESADPRFAPGDLVCGTLPWSEHAVVPADGRGFRRLLKLDPAMPPPVSLALLQSGGLTAYFGLLEVGRAQPGDTVVVSGAAGAVGSTVGQIARILGCRPVGIAGGSEKCAWLRELGFTEAIDYRAGDVEGALRRACPDGAQVFFDNVGGEILEAGIANVARGGRIVLCGAVSQYGAAGQGGALRNHMELVFRSASMQGFLVIDFEARFDAAREQLLSWMREGGLTPRFDIAEGFLRAPEALIRMLEGRNLGRQMIRIDPA